LRAGGIAAAGTTFLGVHTDKVVRKIAEGANDLPRLINRQRANDPLQFLPCLIVGIAMETDRELADCFDNVKDLPAFMQADRVSQDASEQPIS
jgi:hypothetical protein